MPTATSFFQVSGTLGQLSLYRMNGKTFMRRRRTNDPKKWAKITNGAYRSAKAFEGSAKCGNAIYRALRAQLPKAVFEPYSHNKMATLLRKEAYRKHRTTEEYTKQHGINAFLNQDFGHQLKNKAGNASPNIQMRTYGPNHKPEYTHITGLLEAANAIDPTGSMQLQCRIKRINIVFPELQFDNETKAWKNKNREQSPTLNCRTNDNRTTKWIDRDLLESIGLRLTNTDQTTESEHAILTFYVIEWRSIDGPVQGPLHKQATIRCSAVSVSKPQTETLKIYNNLPKPNLTKAIPLPNQQKKQRKEVPKSQRRARALNGWQTIPI